MGRRRDDECPLGASQPPQGRAQAAVGLRLVGLGPQRSRHLAAGDIPVPQREQRDQALGGQRDRCAALVHAQPEPVEQPDVDTGRGNPGIVC